MSKMAKSSSKSKLINTPPKKNNSVLLIVFGASLVFMVTTGVIYWKMSNPSTTLETSVVSSINHDSVVTRSLSKSTFEVNSKFNTDPHPAVKPLDNQYKASYAMAAKFRSLSPKKIQIWYDDGFGGVEQGHLTLGQETTTNTYNGHVFFFTEFGNKDNELARYAMDPDRVLYVIEDPKHPAPHDLKTQNDKEEKFMAEYLEKTGIQWRHYYGPQGPRPPPVLHMWPADKIGTVHSVISHEGQWHCSGTAADCQSTEPVHLDLEVISLKPRAFIIEDFLSSFECDEIIRLAQPHMHHSIVGDVDSGAFESSTRTSKNTWVKRKTNEITESLFLRASHVLQVDEKLLHRRKNAEDMQVVHYVNGQKYDSHHDWGVSGYIESRFITLLLYLTDMEHPKAGGETAFPKANNGQGIKVHPGKGSAVLFYNLLEDGNGDDLALHAALPILQGEKWLANFWVWDPKFKDE